MNLIRRGPILAFLALTAAQALAAGERSPQILVETEYARVAGEAQARETAVRVAAAVDEAVPRIAPFVRTRDLRPVRAYVYLDRESFRRAAGLPRRSAVVGLATFPEETIHIDGTGLLASIERIVPHEVAHIMVGRALGPALPSLPLWANEGIAEYLAGERASRVDPVALQAIGQGRALDLADLDSALQARDDHTALAYAQSASLVNFLVARRGEPVIGDLLAALQHTRDFDSALHQAAGLHVPDLESAWRASLARRWRWPLLFHSGVPILVLMLVLFLIGLVRYYLRRRRRQDMGEQDW